MPKSTIILGVAILLWGYLYHRVPPPAPAIAWVTYVMLALHFLGSNQQMHTKLLVERKDVPEIRSLTSCQQNALLLITLLIAIVDALDVIPVIAAAFQAP